MKTTATITATPLEISILLVEEDEIRSHPTTFCAGCGAELTRSGGCCDCGETLGYSPTQENRLGEISEALKGAGVEAWGDKHGIYFELNGVGYSVKEVLDGATVNLTQHNPTPEQALEGVTPASAEISALITFSAQELLGTENTKSLFKSRAQEILSWVGENAPYAGKVMLGGMPAFMPVLQKALKKAGYTCLYSVSDRVSVDEVQPDGSVIKRSIFKHMGFIQG